MDAAVVDCSGCSSTGCLAAWGSIEQWAVGTRCLGLGSFAWLGAENEELRISTKPNRRYEPRRKQSLVTTTSWRDVYRRSLAFLDRLLAAAPEYLESW